MSANFFVRAPVLIAARLLGEWLTLSAIGKFDSAMCSLEGRIHLIEIFALIVTKLEPSRCRESSLKVLNWLAVRKIRISSIALHERVCRLALTPLLFVTLHSATKLLHIFFHGHNESLRNVLGAIAKNCVNLNEVLFRKCRLDESIRSFLLAQQRLKVLRVLACTNVNPSWFIGLTCSSIMHLEMSAMMCEQTQALVNMCTHLVHFSFSEGKIVISELPQSVRTLHFVKSSVILSKVLNSVKVVALISSNFHVFDRKLLPNVVALNMSKNSHLPARMIATSYKQQLRVLKLRESGGINDYGIKIICESCPSLQIVDISNIPALLPDSVANIADTLTHLHTLCINGLHLSNEVFASVTTSSLVRFEMNNTDGYTHEGIKLLMFGCALLQKISANSEYLTPLVRSVWRAMHPELQFVPEADIYETFS